MNPMFSNIIKPPELSFYRTKSLWADQTKLKMSSQIFGFLSHRIPHEILFKRWSEGKFYLPAITVVPPDLELPQNAYASKRNSGVLSCMEMACMRLWAVNRATLSVLQPIALCKWLWLIWINWNWHLLYYVKRPYLRINWILHQFGDDEDEDDDDNKRFALAGVWFSLHIININIISHQIAQNLKNSKNKINQ